LLRRQRHFILEKLVGRSDKDAALAAGYSIWIATNTKQKIWAKPGVREEYERLKVEIIEVYYDQLRSAINGTPAFPSDGACKELRLESTPIAP
jgi:phage terminase small subunit